MAWLCVMTAAVAAPAQDACRAAKVTASDPAAFDSLGIAVAVSGSTALAGAQWQDDSGTDSGAAYVYGFDGTTWVQTQVLLAPDGHADDLFGRALAMDGDALVVGAPGHVHGEGSGSGSAYVFRREGTLWVPEQELLASDGPFQDGFGASVAVSGNVVLIGALLAAASNAGAAYVFRFNPVLAQWVQEQKLTAADCAAGDLFGHAVSIIADVILVGAMHDDDNGPNSGSAYVLRYDPRVGAWMDEQKLIASDGHHR